MAKYLIEIDDKTLNAILIALGSRAWENRDTSAFDTYDKAYKSIDEQVEKQRRKMFS